MIIAENIVSHKAFFIIFAPLKTERHFMEYNFSPEMVFAFEEAKKYAIQHKSPFIGVEHIMLAILRYPEQSITKKLMDLYQVDIEALAGKFEEMLAQVENDGTTEENPRLSVQAENTIRVTYLLSKKFRSNKMEAHFFVLAVLKEDRLSNTNATRALLTRAGLSYNSVLNEVQRALNIPNDEEEELVGAGDDDDERVTAKVLLKAVLRSSAAFQGSSRKRKS